MQAFVPALASELERPRSLSPAVAAHISSHYDVSRDEIGTFLTGTLPGLEDYEVDLVLSPVFTPDLGAQARVSPLVSRDTLPADAWPALVSALEARPTRAVLVTEDGQSHAVPLRAVTIDRYVSRLNLDRPIPERFGRLFDALPPEADRAGLQAVVRRAIWQEEARASILFDYLKAVHGGGGVDFREVVQLLQVMETYEPQDRAELLSRIPAWEEVLEGEIQVASSPKVFFNEQVKEMHGGPRDQRGPDEGTVAVKKRHLAFLGKLRRILGAGCAIPLPRP